MSLLDKNKIGSYCIKTKYGLFSFLVLKSGNLEIIYPPYNKINTTVFLNISPLLLKRVGLNNGFDRIILLEKL